MGRIIQRIPKEAMIFVDILRSVEGRKHPSSLSFVWFSRVGAQMCRADPPAFQNTILHSLRSSYPKPESYILSSFTLSPEPEMQPFGCRTLSPQPYNTEVKSKILSRKPPGPKLPSPKAIYTQSSKLPKHTGLTSYYILSLQH